MKISKPTKILTINFLILAATPLVSAQDTNEPGTLNALFNRELPDAIGKAKISVNSRLRWEHADADAVGTGPDPKESNAITLRTRFGIMSAPLYGFQGMLEAENITSVFPDHNYNAAGANEQPTRTIIADPETTELNQGWLSYSRWNSLLKGGRQRLVLDNHRFVGDVGWRQNQQTFDAITLENKSIENVSLLYGYIWEVNRVFGDAGFAPAAIGNQDFDSSSHIFNASYSGWEFGKFVAYTYLLDLENGAGAAPSSSTCGASFAGSAPVTEKVKLEYRAEFAWQTDYADNPSSYGTEYYNVELGANVKPVLIGGGYEVLGSDSGSSFRTPLATLHGFNGWADVFLTTPAAGLRDIYAFAQVALPWEMPLRVVYHKFDSDAGSIDLGQEFDVMLSKKLGKHWTALAKYAHYDASGGALADVDKAWLQLEFNF